MNSTIKRTLTQLRLGAAILRTTGTKVFVQRWLYFCGSHFFNYQTFYVYRVKLDKPLSFQLPSAAIECKLLEKTNDFASLVKEGYDFGPFVVRDDNRLEQGALSLCFFQNKIISHIAWIALDQRAKESLADFPFPVVFEHSEAYLGRLARNPKLKRPTFSAVVIFFKALELLQGMGKKGCNFIVRQNNIIPQLGLAKRADIRPCASASYLKILWWHWWWEKPLKNQPKAILRHRKSLQCI